MFKSIQAALGGAQHVAVQWDFNTTNSPGASLGTGTYSLLGPVSADFFGGSPSDPGLPSSNYALSLTGFPAQGEGPKTSGVEFLCDTRWWRDFRLVFDFRGSPSASSTIVILCSTNSTDFFDAGHFSINTADLFLTGLTLDLASHPELNHAPELRFRLVSDYAPATELYAPIQTDASYSPAGRWRLDMVTLYGTPEPPRIIGQPQSSVLSVPEPVTLSVVAEGLSPIAYQWKHSGTNLPGATHAELIISNPTAGDLGQYQVVVSNIGGECQSDVVSLTAAKPQILIQPNGQIIDGSTPVALQIHAVGIEPLTYQWFHCSTNLPGQTEPTLTITQPTSLDLGPYYVLVTNAGGTTVSEEAVLSAAAPVITSDPESCTVTDGAYLRLECVSTGLLPLQYHWFHNGAALNGATEPVLVFTNVSLVDAGDYFVVVSNAGGSVTSAVANVTVQPAPTKVNISQLRATLDPQTLDATDTNTLFTVEGVVVSHCDLAPEPDVKVFIQDPTAGIAVHWAGGANVLEINAGDLVRLTGRLTNHDGLLTLNTAIADSTTAIVPLETGRPLPLPVTLDLSALPVPSELDQLEGSLVVISNVVMDISLTNFPASAQDFYIADFEGNTFMLQADSASDLPGKPLPKKLFVVTGILIQRDNESPYTNSYAVLPTRYSDITENDQFPFFDQPTVTPREAPNGTPRQFGTNPNTANSWQWRVLIRPASSTAEIVGPTTRTPTFTPDQPGRYALHLRTAYETGITGASCIEFESIPNQPPIIHAPDSIVLSEADWIDWQGLGSYYRHIFTASAEDPDDTWPWLSAASILPGFDTDYIEGAGGETFIDVYIWTDTTVFHPGECGASIGQSETLGSGTYVITLAATDRGVPPLTSYHTTSVSVLEDNKAPCVPLGQCYLDPRQVITVAENELNELRLEAYDWDAPLQRLEYEIAPLPGEVTLYPETGILRWIPPESLNAEWVSPFPISYRVTDELGASSESTCIWVEIQEINSQPVFTPIADLSIREKDTVLLQVQVSDLDIPTNQITVALKSGPPGMTLDPATWVLSWTPTEADGGTTNLVVVEATDDGVPPLSTNMSFLIVTEKVNEPPKLQDPGTQFANEHETFTLNLVAADDDLPPNELTFVLLDGPPGMTLDPVSGVIRWQPGEEHGPGQFTVVAMVSDDGTPPLTDTKSFQVNVSEVNEAPTITEIPDASINPKESLHLLCAAVDPDIPANTLTWELVEGPSGAAINASTGELTWNSDYSHAGQTFRFTVLVTDNGSPPLSDQKTFQVTVNPIPAPDPTGIQWALVSTGFNGRLWGVEYGAGLFVAVGANGTILTSPDGLSWTQRVTPTTETLWGLKYGCGRFVVAAHNGVILTSTNGIDWELSPSGVTAHLTDVAFAGETCVVVGNFNTILTSPRGEGPWTLCSVATTNHFQDVTYGGGYFVASGTMGLIATSPNGTSWTVQNSGTTNGVPMTAYGNGVCIVGGEGGLLLRSTDLVEWDQAIPVPLVPPIGHLAGASHANGRFVVVGGTRNGMSGGVVLVSTNGLDWVQEDAGDFPMLYDVAYGPGVWVAVGENGAVLRSLQLFPPWALNVESTPGGTLERNPDRVLYEDGESVTITAVPDSIHVFTGWSGDVIGDSSSIQLRMDTNKFVTANFTRKFGYVLTVAVSGNGSLTLTPEKPQYEPGEVVQLTANPDAGWLFIDWAGACSGTNSAESVTMDGDKWIRARFMAPPVVSPVQDQIVNELAKMQLTVSATDPDSPPEDLRYMLVEGPAEAAVDAVTGGFEWTPSEAQGPGTCQVRVRVTDGGTPALSDEITFQVMVAEVNSPPSLVFLPDRTLDERQYFSFVAMATDRDLPKQALTYSLVAGPANAEIDPATGLLSFTPSEAQGPGVHTVTIKVTDNGTPPLSDSKTFRITVRDVNQAPVLEGIADRTADEGTLLQFSASAWDSDVPAQSLAFALENAPAGAVIDPTTGVFAWTPTEEQGPGVYTMTVRVTDDGTPPLSNSKPLKVTVNEVNRSPSVAAFGDQTVGEGELLAFSAAATDGDVPAQTLTFSLEGAPAGTGIDPATGAFSWTPTEEQGPGVYTMTVRVTDDGTPPLSNSKPLTVRVSEVNQKPTLTPLADQVVDEGQVLLLAPKATDDDIPANTLTCILGPGAPDGATVNPTTGAFYWRPSEGQGPGHYTMSLRVLDDGTPPLDDRITFTVNVREVNRAPVLDPIARQTLSVGETLRVTAVAKDQDVPGNQLEYSLVGTLLPGALIDSATGVFTWKPSWEFAFTTNQVSIRVTDDGLPPLSDTVAFEVVVGATGEIRLTCAMSPGGEFRLYVTSEPGRTLFVETTSDLEEWTLLTTLVGTGQPVDVTDAAGLVHERRFYRVVSP